MNDARRLMVAVHLTRRRFTVDEYHQMAKAGILGEDDRVELIEGEVAEMTPIGRRHAACVDRLNDLLTRTFADIAIVRVQSPIQLDDYTEPQPDLALLHRRPDYYAYAHPRPTDVFWLIEVAETSSGPDRRVKVPLYARSGIIETWLVDLEQENITIYREPTPGGYRIAQVARHGEQIAPSACPDRALTVDDILV